jgi:hypothetical protein
MQGGARVTSARTRSRRHLTDGKVGVGSNTSTPTITAGKD